MAVVELAQVSAGYGPPGETGAGLTLRQVDLRLKPGELCAVLGPNGAGKSTLVRLIAGLIPALSGQVRIFGTEIDKLDRRAIARNIAVVAQQNEVAMGFTVREVVAMGRAPHQGLFQRSGERDRVIVERAIATCRLEELAHRMVAELSGGEQKRVHIARALAQRAPILCLDEASAHLDMRHSVALYQLVRDEVTARRITCLAVMHDLEAASRVADRIVLLKAGAVVAEGEASEILTEELLRETFDVEIETGISPQGRRYFLPSPPGRSQIVPSERETSQAEEEQR